MKITSSVLFIWSLTKRKQGLSRVFAESHFCGVRGSLTGAKERVALICRGMKKERGPKVESIHALRAGVSAEENIGY